jgi:sugar phosphate isomerase/epimerase
MKQILRIALAWMFTVAAFGEGLTPAEKLGFKLAVHSYTFQKYTVFEAIAKTAGLGVKQMSISGSVNLPGPEGQLVKQATVDLSEQDWQSIQARMWEAGIESPFLNMGVVKLGLDEGANRKVFEGARRMGISVLVSEPETHGKMEELGPVMDGIEKLCGEYGIRVAIHNHPGPKNFYWNPETVLAAVNGRSSRVGVCADVGHWVRSGLDPVECLRKLEGRIIALHFKDLSDATLQGHDVPWGAGISNPKAMLVELQRQGFKGAICIEYEHNWESSVPEIAKCVEWFHATCAELAR